MAYQALYRKYRPTNFDEVVGQEHIIQTLKNAIYQNRIAHAYLFCGPRGTGKTTIAKIFAKMLNCESENKPCEKCMNCQMASNGNHPDIIEIDAASNNGVDEVRNLIDKVKYAPLQGKYKVYIIDEVHMMSTGAFNALLKTIEEPPEHVIFIFATTEPNKVLPTIISRCQRYDFSKVSKSNIKRRLKIVCEAEKIVIEESALELIAQLADGGMRDSLSILDQCVAYCVNNIKLEDVRKIYGVLNLNDIALLYSLFAKRNINELMSLLDKYADEGIDLQKFVKDFIKLLKDSIILDFSENTTLINSEEKDIIYKYISNYSTKEKIELLDNLIDMYSKITFSSNIIDYIQTVFLKVIYNNDNQEKSEIHIDKIKDSNKDSEINPDEKIIDHSEYKSEIDNSADRNESEIEKSTSDVSRETLKDDSHQSKKFTLNDEFVLQLLVGANKIERIEDTKNILNVSNYIYDLKYAKFANTLRNINLVASGDNYIVVSTNSELEAENINELEHKDSYVDFMKIILGKKKKVFAIYKNHMNGILIDFKERWKSKTLPKPIVITISNDNTETNLKTTESQLKEVFPTLNIVED